MKWKPIREIKYIVIHCAATTADMDIGASDIKKWHLQRGWMDIGYHKVIKRDGTIEDGRNLNVPGAHARGYNHVSWGICLVGGADANGKGEDNFTPAQWAALAWLVLDMKEQVPNAEVLGHRDLPNVNKDCPSFDARTWYDALDGEVGS